MNNFYNKTSKLFAVRASARATKYTLGIKMTLKVTNIWTLSNFPPFKPGLRLFYLTLFYFIYVLIFFFFLKEVGYHDF